MDVVIREAVSQTARRGVASLPVTTRNCLSIDVEEYFHCEVYAQQVRADGWHMYARRAQPCLERIAALLDATDSRATFFVLGWMVKHLKPLLRELVGGGHEIACHGDMHQHLSRMTPATLHADLRRSRGVIEDALGVSPTGYRAPTFSITRATAWALDVVLDAGFSYDASIFPIRHDRYGVPDAPLAPFEAVAPSGQSITEFPPLVCELGRLRVPVGGGGYLRLLPVGLIRRCLRQAEQRQRPTMIYLHPWELDPDQPRLPVGLLSQWRHRVNLHTTERKLSHLLTHHRFDTAERILATVRREHDLPTFQL